MPVSHLDAQDATLHTVQDILLRFLAESRGSAPETIDPDSHLTEYAVTSVQLLQIHGRLEEAFGVEVPASALFEYETVTALAGYLSSLQ